MHSTNRFFLSALSSGYSFDSRESLHVTGGEAVIPPAARVADASWQCAVPGEGVPSPGGFQGPQVRVAPVCTWWLVVVRFSTS